MKIISHRELMLMEIPKPDWYVPNLIPEGLTLLGGPAKIGKSLMALNIATAMASKDGIALGAIPIETSRRVLYLDMENTMGTMQSRSHNMSPDDMLNTLNFALDVPKFDAKGMVDVKSAIDDYGIEFMVVDTWKAVEPVGKNLLSGSSYDIDYESMRPIQEFSHEHGIGIMLVWHARKAKDFDNIWNQFQGSMGVQASCDSMLLLDRTTDGINLHVIGREIQETEYAITMTNDGIWQLEGESSEIYQSPERKELLAIIREFAADGIREGALVKQVGRSQPSVHKMLAKMVAKGQIEKRDSKYYPVVS